MDNFSIAIDGPAGSGKSTISQKVAKKLNFVHMDTGAMYRAVTLEALRRNINANNEEEITFVKNIKVIYENGAIYLNDEDVSAEIRSVEVSNKVSLISSYKVVRDEMVKFQQLSAAKGNILMDGRDIGTVVLPKADVKIFLTANPNERAKRRFKELQAKGANVTYEEVLSDLVQRDNSDANRTHSPLLKAKDAIVLDTTDLTIEEVCNEIIKIVNEKRSKYE